MLYWRFDLVPVVSRTRAICNTSVEYLRFYIVVATEIRVRTYIHVCMEILTEAFNHAPASRYSSTI